MSKHLFYTKLQTYCVSCKVNPGKLITLTKKNFKYITPSNTLFKVIYRIL